MYWHPLNWIYQGQFVFPSAILLMNFWAYQSWNLTPLILLVPIYLYYVISNWWDSRQYNPYRNMSADEIRLRNDRDNHLHDAHMFYDEGDLHRSFHHRDKAKEYKDQIDLL